VEKNFLYNFTIPVIWMALFAAVIAIGLK